MSKEFNLIVRLAGHDDFQAIADAHQASILELAPGHYDEDVVRYWGRQRDPDAYRDVMEKCGEVFWVAEQDGKPGYVLGFSAYRYEEERHRLQGLYVRGTEARRGLGKRLLDVVEAHARAAGAQDLHVEASLPGEPFYLANGFEELSRGVRTFGDTEAPVIMMAKPL